MSNKTIKLYDEKPYAANFEAEILDIISENNKIGIILNQTLFFPEEGGQTPDRGKIKISGAGEETIDVIDVQINRYFTAEAAKYFHEVEYKDIAEKRDEIISKAQIEAKAEADKIIAAAKSEIASEKEAAMAELSSKVADLSVQIAEKILRKELDSDTKQDSYVKSLVADISLN